MSYLKKCQLLINFSTTTYDAVSGGEGLYDVVIDTMPVFKFFAVLYLKNFYF